MLGMGQLTQAHPTHNNHNRAMDNRLVPYSGQMGKKSNSFSSILVYAGSRNKIPRPGTVS